MTSLPSTFPISVHQAHVLSGMSVTKIEEEYLQTDKDLRRRLMKGTGKGTVPRETKSIRTRKP